MDDSDNQSVSEPSIYANSGSEYEPAEDHLSPESDDSTQQSQTQALVSSDEEELRLSDAPSEDQPTEKAKKKTRKRQQHESLRAARKRKRNSGMAYKTKKGHLVSAKKFANIPCLCKKQCSNQVSEETRKHAFSIFWKLGSFAMQNAYLCGIVKQEPPKIRRPRNGSRQGKSSSNTFFIQDRQGNTVKVCRKYFVDTFQISNGRLTRALKKIKECKPPGSDERGSHVPANKIAVDRMNVVREHINSFPSYQSHYSRSQNPDRKYLSSDLTVSSMYQSYLQYCTGKSEPVSESVYRRVFSSEFNLHFHSPLKDTCSKCDSFKNKLPYIESEEEKRSLTVSHELHLRRAEAARSAQAEDANKSKNDPSTFAFTFDLEKALPFPKLTTGIAYYKRNMYLYNLGIHELNTNLGFMYTWDETVASRGSQEISSCVTKHLRTRAKNYRHIIMYSDTCTGQNRNWNFALAMQKLTQTTDTACEIIDLKYMVSGHSFLPNDTDFASIESYAKKKLQVVFSPDEWINAIFKCRSKNPFHVTRMNRENFYSTKELTDAITRRSVNERGDKFSWLKIQWIRFIREEPFKLFYKESIQNDVPFSTVSLEWSNQKKKKHRNAEQVPIGLIEQKQLYNAPRPVTKEKKRDMLDLLEYIPPVHHAFYHGLITSDSIEDTGFLEQVQPPED